MEFEWVLVAATNPYLFLVSPGANETVALLALQNRANIS